MIVEIDGWKTGITFSAAHIIPSHGKCERLHGHVYGVRVRIYGKNEVMVVDFVKIKDVLRDIVSALDHHVLLPTKSPHIRIEQGDNVGVNVHGKHYVFPREDVKLLDVVECTAEQLAKYILNTLMQRLGDVSVDRVELCVEEGPGQGAWAVYEG
ncbi:MAG: 6-pyruvoyl tetrahydropterin synthase family protein [Thermoplasmata archaeon]|nr:MAG: 6-pyruvoyl tetrahydropterin synthase family protein [Thermoplasmata archaeon]